MRNAGHSRTLNNGLLGLHFCVAVAIALSPARSVLAGGDPTVVTKIAEIGDPAPGVGEGMIYEEFHLHPLVELIIDFGSNFPAPLRVDALGNVTFHAYVGDDGNADVNGPSALFKRVNGEFELITLTDAPAPGTDTGFVGAGGLGFLFVPPTPFIEDGKVMFTMAFGDNPFNADLGVWTDRSGDLAPMVLQGDNLPGMIPSDAMGVPVVSGRPETVLIDAEVEHDTNCCNSHPGAGCDQPACEEIICDLDPSCCTSSWDLSCGNAADDLCIECGGWEGELDLHPEGLWRETNGVFETLILTNEPAIGYPDGIVYGSANTSNLFGSVGSIAFDDQDRVAVTTFVKGPGIGTPNNEAIYIETDQGLEMFLIEGTPAPPELFGPGATFSSNNTLEGAFFGQAMARIKLTNNGTLLFPAMVDIPGDPPVVPTLWSAQNGELELLVRGFLNGVAHAQPGTPAPGVEGGEFFAFPIADINQRGDVLITAFVETDSDIFTSTFGFWINRGDGWVPVGFEEGPVPDHPGITFLPEINNVRGLGRAVLQEDGSVLFDGRFFNEQGNFTIGFFKQEANGIAHQLFETSGVVQIGDGGDDVRTVERFRLGAGITADGLRPIELTFPDGPDGLYLFDAMADVAPTGDLDGDGTVGAADLAILLGSWGPCADPEDCPADLDGDGTVGAADLAILLGSWG